MKKLLLIAMALVATFTAKAETKEFTDNLSVTVDGNGSTQTATVQVDFLEDDFINFRLNNFILTQTEGEETNEMYVGNIAVNNLYLTQKDGYQAFSYNANLMIAAGDKEGVDEGDWIGPLLGPVPVVLNGTLNGDQIFVNIDINMVSLEQIISVKFGKQFIADPTVVSTKDFTATMTTLMTGDQEGETVTIELMPQTITTTLQSLSNGNINLNIKNLMMATGAESMPLGDLPLNNIELMKRGVNTFFYSGFAGFEGEESTLAGALVTAQLQGKWEGEDLFYTLTVNVPAMNIVFDFTFSENKYAPTVLSSKTYDDNIVVRVNESETAPMAASVKVDRLSNGNINFSLPDFIMELEGNKMYVGNIYIEDLPLIDGEDKRSYELINYNGMLRITEGSDSEQFWIGPELGFIPLRLKGKLTDDKLYVIIDIDMQESLSQTIFVDFGSDITNGITSIGNEQLTKDNAIYDLSGRRVQKATRGIYIQNGKKFIR